MADCCSWGLQRVQVGLVESRSRGPDWRRRPDPAGFDRLVASGQVAPLDFAAVRRNGFALLILFISDFAAGWMQNLCIE
jgi:hypothetical protein